jgi:bilirubin oxidase
VPADRREAGHIFNRRQLLKYGAGAGVALYLPWGLNARRAIAASSSPSLPGTGIPKYELPLVIPPAMPRTGTSLITGGKNADYYEIAVRQFSQRILPPSLPETTVWSYGSVRHPATFNYPAFTIEASWRRPVRVKWINDLVKANGDFLPHLLPVDPTLHWANPPGGTAGRDTRPDFDLAGTPGPYTGPVPIVTHLHGGEATPQESDGYPESWFLPAADNIPAGYATTGTFYDVFKQSSPLGASWAAGTAVFQYPNDQRAATLWYHDHTLGMTRLNVYAGPAGFYLLRGGPSDIPGRLPRPAPATGDRPGTSYYEIPIAIQDRSFNDDGSLFYPDSREYFDGFAGPYIGAEACDGAPSDISPIFNPEVFGDTMVVNGRSWPFLEVEQRRYRFRFLNGCNSRFLILTLDNDLPFWQIGSEGGFLPQPVRREQLLMGPAERADVIVDFTDVPAGTEIILLNIGPDEPFGGGKPGVDFTSADPSSTGQVMQLRVVPSRHSDPSLPPDHLRLPKLEALGTAELTRRVSLNEEGSETVRTSGEPPVLNCDSGGEFGPREALLGTMDGEPNPLKWSDPVTENPTVDATEVWELHNFTEDAHPIHIHELQFEVVNRQPFEGAPYDPEPWETGRKDTVIAYPGEITRVKATFGVPGRFVWHCHIVEHEDNEMMRPYVIGPAPEGAPAPAGAPVATRRKRRRKRKGKRARRRSSPPS